MKARVLPDPGGCERISYQALENLELEISRGTGSYSADSGDRTSSRGQHPWPDQVTQTWRTRASEKHALQGARDQRLRRSGETSQKTEDQRKGTETTKREGLEIMDCTKGQADCKAGRAEKSKLEAERSRGMAEKIGTVESDTETKLEGRNKASATTFSKPGTWTISLVNSEI